MSFMMKRKIFISVGTVLLSLIRELQRLTDRESLPTPYMNNVAGREAHCLCNLLMVLID